MKISKLFSLSLFSLGLFALLPLHASEPAPSPEETAPARNLFIPEALNFVEFRMPLDVFQREVVARNPDRWRSSPAGTTWLLSFTDQPFQSATLIFDANQKILIEVQLRFPDSEAAADYVQQHIRPRGEFQPETRTSAAHYRLFYGYPSITSRAWSWNERVFIIVVTHGTKWGS